MDRITLNTIRSYRKINNDSVIHSVDIPVLDRKRNTVREGDTKNERARVKEREKERTRNDRILRMYRNVWS